MSYYPYELSPGPQPPEKFSARYLRFPRRLTAENRVLIVDDDAGMRDQLFEVLHPLGYKVDRFDSGHRALEYLAAGHWPSVILLDIKLGNGMDGWGFAREIRENEKFREIPIIALTGYAPDPRYLRNGTVDAILTKPFDLEDFLSNLRVYQPAYSCAS